MGPEGMVRGLTGNPEVALQVSGWRPEGTTAATVSATGPDADKAGAQAVVETLSTADEWATIFLFAGDSAELSTNGFVPGGYDPRLLGIRVTSIIADRASAPIINEAHR